ncbi:MAG: hypothetical protein LQ340_002377 [Diploschistes diacapsis]|nr:MAG: hypothetical protein LQ340_002377 [Diploschistes diacapsis]
MAKCVWNNEGLDLGSETLAQLPKEVLETLQGGSNLQYLDALAELALEPGFTETVFVRYGPLFVDFCGRWLLKLKAGPSAALQIVFALSKVLLHAHHLSSVIEEIACHRRLGVFNTLKLSASSSAILDLPQSTLRDVLLIFVRLLQYDNKRFEDLLSPMQLLLLLNHETLCIRYLAAKAFCLLLHLTEKVLHSLIEQYVGSGPLEGKWEGKDIDYRFHDLWEAKRQRDLRNALSSFKEISRVANIGPCRIIQSTDLCPQTINFAGHLTLALSGTPILASSLVLTPTSSENLVRVAGAVCEAPAILVSGLAGSGKTTIIKEIARGLGQASRMLTLHLNEQTDAKLLVGFYTSSIESGSFKWQPGILTTAVTEGRWVLIEDLDRAPVEVVSTLLPLLDRQELMVSNLGGAVRASRGFKLIATVRSSLNTKSEELDPAANMIGYGRWKKVRLRPYSEIDLQQIIDGRFPLLGAYRSMFLNLYAELARMAPETAFARESSRVYGPQEILRYCRRVNELLRRTGITSREETVPELIQEEIYLEAIDCFSSAVPERCLKFQIAKILARELHVPETRMRFYLDHRKVSYRLEVKKLQIGRVILRRRHNPNLKSRSLTSGSSKNQKFAKTNHALRSMEAMAAAVRFKEPCLLVGETGTGKTTIIQELANSLGQRLVVVNLSQQSEAGDLLGGFKPVDIRTLATPIKDEFELLFDETFSFTKNQRYLKSFSRAFKKHEWSKVLTLWEEALRMINATFSSKPDRGDVANPQKKRKVESTKFQPIKARWVTLATQIDVFRKHLRSGSKGFAFSFIEGNVVKAVRNGYWVLLDEINLASPDILESLADLLTGDTDNIPSLLLSETGEVQRICAHPDFRIFGAMNPATDVGKKCLPPGLRSRFTEFFITSPEEDERSLLQIVQAYLGDLSIRDTHLSRDIAKLYLDIRNLENINQLVDGANQKPHFTLRTLTRTLTYASDITPIYGLHRALYEGFAMSFLTVLDRHSASIVASLIDKHLLATHPNIRALLHQVPRCPGSPETFIQFQHYWMSRGPFGLRTQPHYIRTPFVEANLLNLVRATSTRRYPILLQGPTSSGKTSMIEYLAGVSGNKFVRINNHEHTDLQEYLGTYVSTATGLHFQEGALVRALREGHWLVLDELNLAPTDILEALNRLLDDNRELFVPETQEIIRPHEDFMLFATQNPPGLYGGRKILSRAFRNRFLELHFDDIPEDELEEILQKRTQIAPSYCTRIVAVYKKLAILRQSNRLFEQKNSFATLRDLFRWAYRTADNVEQLAVNGFMLLAERVRDPQEREDVKKIIEEVMRCKLVESDIYDPAKLPKRTFSDDTPMARSIVMTRSMVRLFALVSRALENSEPVLLVGGTGCGKTSICQMVAEVFGTKLHILNAHQNTETGDLIGSQRPVRNRPHIQALLYDDLRVATSIIFSYPQGEMPGFGELAESYANLSTDVKQQLPSELRQRIDGNSARGDALFEWLDGSLVHAMKAGSHFLLDEISLADDSVLERLNSVLEPGRSLLLAEKDSLDSFIVAHKSFQFLATMNPGGDYGKKELSPALRNRFTEIWVPQPNGDEDVLQITRSKLDAQLLHLAEPLVSFSRWFETRYQEGEPSISLRQILTWIEFLNLSPEENVQSCIVNGAAMVYIDTLGANPSGKVGTSMNSISQERQASLERLGSLFTLDAAAIYFDKPELIVSSASLTIGSFSIPRHGEENKSINFNLQTPTTLNNAMRIVRALQFPNPILIEGNPGVGKSTLVGALGELANVHLTRINLSEQTDIMDLFGSDVPVEDGEAGQFQWRDAPFLQAMQCGNWVLLDEMNLASQSILEGLNACLDHRGEVYVPELDRSITRHSNFRLFAAQNPHSQGGGRKGLPASFVNRFTVVYADVLSEHDLLEISTKLYPDVSTESVLDIVRYISRLNEIANATLLSSVGAPWEFNLRDVLRWLDLLSSKGSLLAGTTPSDLEHFIVQNRFRSDEDIARVGHFDGFAASGPPKSHSYFKSTSPAHLQSGYGFLERHETSSVRPTKYFERDPRLVESILISVQKSWPCLLVDSSGAEASNILHDVAAMFGARISTMSLNSDTDTMDLVGGYEQVDHQRDAAKYVERLREALQDCIAQGILDHANMTDDAHHLQQLMTTPRANLEAIHEALKCHPGPSSNLFQSLAKQCSQVMQRNAKDSRSRFEWVDSVFIEALEQGRWLVLDNANLCSSSVLDRLNALLEPSGILSVNEHRYADGSPRIVVPHPNFRLFLIMDPRYGELSRAMRNRCVEVYVQSRQNSSLGSAHTLHLDSTLSRWYAVESVNWNVLSSDEAKSMARVCLEQLAIGDFDSIAAWREEVSRGLIVMSQEKLDLLLLNCRIFEQSVKSGSFQSVMYELYKSTLSEIYTKSSLHVIRAQPLNPLNNPPLISQLRKTNKLGRARWIADALDSRLIIIQIEIQLTVLGKLQHSHGQASLNRLERSLLFNQSGTYSKDSTRPLATFLQHNLALVDSWINETCATESWPTTFPKAIAPYLLDLFEMSQVVPFDEGRFQAYLDTGRALAQTLNSGQNTVELSKSLKRTFSMFDSSWKLTSGLSMTVLWHKMKPAVPSNRYSLKHLLDLEASADAFDRVAWKSSASLQSLIDLHHSFSSALQKCRDANEFVDKSDIVSDSQDIARVLDKEAADMHIDNSLDGPYFREQFESLRQYIWSSGSRITTEGLMVLDVLSGRKTKGFSCSLTAPPCNQFWNRLCSQTGIDTDGCQLSAFRGSLPSSIIRKLLHLSEVPLKSLQRLTEEITLFANRIAKATQAVVADQQLCLRELLSSLLIQVLEAHAELLTPGNLEQWAQYLRNPTKVARPIIRLANTSQATQEIQDGWATWFHQTVSQYFYPALDYLESIGNNNHQSSKSASHAWLNISLGCLKLYVPNAPTDPATKPLVEAERWSKRRRRLELHLAALETLEEHMSGTRTNLRVELVRQELDSMEQKPLVPAIVRPTISTLPQLQHEFNMILQVIMPSCETLLTHSYKDNLQDAELCERNIIQMLARLDGCYREYDDIVRPLVGILQGLSTAIALRFVERSSLESSSKLERPEAPAPALLGLNMQEAIAKVSKRSEADHPNCQDSRVMALQYVELEKCVCGDVDNDTTAIVTSQFRLIYNYWKAELQARQAREAADSSLYRYKGDNPSVAEMETELQSLFPNAFEKREDSKTSAGSLKLGNPQALAQSLAKVQRTIFMTNPQHSTAIVDYVKAVAGSIELASPEGHDFPLERATLLPVALLKTSEAIDYLGNACNKDIKAGFYHGNNTHEARKLLGLLCKLRLKFRSIQTTWPEHATLADVLLTIEELLDCKHTEPLAKIIAKTEKLHSFVHEWQQVASKDSSAQPLYEELTKLLISWRRLELSDWAKLLDVEDEKHAAEAESWWFIVFEAIFPSFLDALEVGSDMQPYIDSLVAEIHNFIKDAPIGQFQARLRLISAFEEHTKCLSQSSCKFQLVNSALANAVRYFARWIKQAKAQIERDREQLAKKMKEILLLASWKDTNVVSLRESARKSHYALLNIIRKYREVLARPTSEILQEPADFEPSGPICEIDERSYVCQEPDTVLIERCQRSFSTWHQQAPRLNDPVKTAAFMIQMSEFPRNELDSELCIDAFKQNLLVTIRGLQQETPKSLTPENKTHVKHLKTRKKTLLADTLKQLRQMGIRSNLDSETLARQATTDKILSCIPSFQELQSSADEFFGFLDHVSLVRQALKQKSHDLTPNEVARSCGFLDGLLYHLTTQRRGLGKAIAEIRACDKLLTSLSTLWCPSIYTVHQENSQANGSGHHLRRIRWLKAILEATFTVIEKLENMGGEDYASLKDNLRLRTDHIASLQKTMESFPTLISGLVTSAHEANALKIDKLCASIGEDVDRWSYEFPNAKFVLEHIEPWLHKNAHINQLRDLIPTQAPVNGEVSKMEGTERSNSTRVDERQIFDLVDRMLVGIQQLKKRYDELPLSSEESAWAVREEFAFDKATMSLCLGKMTARIDQEILQKLASCASSDFEAACALCTIILPIIKQYRNTFSTLVKKRLANHKSLSSLARVLASSFNRLLKQGFCSPKEESNEESQSAEVEDGVGLGEGEGVENISKDIGDDEDLSELAQEHNPSENRKTDDAQDEDDAVDMQNEELEGDVADATGNSADENEEQDEGMEDEGGSDEVGSVDDLDPSALDEKLWNNKSEKEQHEDKEGEIKGEKNGETGAQNQEDKRSQAESVTSDEDMDSEEEPDEETTHQLELEQLDPHIKEGENLDLPEDMDADGGISPVSMNDDEEFKDLSDIESDEEEALEDADVGDGRVEMEDVEEPTCEGTKADEEDVERESRSAMEKLDSDLEDLHETEGEDSLQHLDSMEMSPIEVYPDEAQGSGAPNYESESLDHMNTTVQNQEANQSNGQMGKGSQGNADTEDFEAQDKPNASDVSQTQKEAVQDPEDLPFRKLGDALEKWHRTSQDVQNGNQERKENAHETSDKQMSKQFEHLRNEDQKPDAQALGAASQEDAKALNQQEMQAGEVDDMPDSSHSSPFSILEPEDTLMNEDGVFENEQFNIAQTNAWDSKRDTRSLDRPQKAEQTDDNDQNESVVDEIDNDLSIVQLNHANERQRSLEEARRLWFHYEKTTRDLAISLTEQLRLILAPSRATKMRGDFRTGKRLNVKRIIPYIASQYKRDKIWMRRSIPSKRNYQVMIAVDDSRSMEESGSGKLAFESLALLSRSLSMLEVGQICVASFGEVFRVAHPFEQQFSNESAISVLQHFGFRQSRTNIRNLLSASLEVFRQARAKQAASGTDLWQLQLIISDGVCEDHDFIRQLVRQAHAERIMIVFTIINAASGHSILDMTQASFEPDRDGETKLKMKRYLDGFPFSYYLIVRDVKSLPNALSAALRQWFAEISDLD